MPRLTPFAWAAALLFAANAQAASNITNTTCSGTTSVQTGCITLNLSSIPNVGSVSVQVSGTWTGTLEFEGSNTGTAFVSLRAYPVPSGAYLSNTAANGFWQVDTAGALYVRVRASAITSGTAVVAMQPSTALITTDVVRAVGPTNGSLDVTGTVTANLGQASLDAIAAPECTLPSTPPAVTLTTTPQDVPASPLPDRTRVLIINESTAQDVWCCIGAACAPTSTARYRIAPGGGSRALPVRGATVVRCRSAAGTASIGVEEESCG